MAFAWNISDRQFLQLAALDHTGEVFGKVGQKDDALRRFIVRRFGCGRTL